MLHIMYAGEQHDWSFDVADLSMESTDAQVKQSLANLLGIPEAKLQGWNIDRSVEGNITVRPAAVFGSI